MRGEFLIELPSHHCGTPNSSHYDEGTVWVCGCGQGWKRSDWYWGGWRRLSSRKLSSLFRDMEAGRSDELSDQ